MSCAGNLRCTRCFRWLVEFWKVHSFALIGLTPVQAAQDILTELNVPSGDCAICLVDFNMDEADAAGGSVVCDRKRLSTTG